MSYKHLGEWGENLWTPEEREAFFLRRHLAMEAKHGKGYHETFLKRVYDRDIAAGMNYPGLRKIP